MIEQTDFSLSPVQELLIWGFAALSFIFGIMSAGAFLIAPSGGILFLFPFILLNFPISIATLCCGGYLYVHRQVTLATLVVMSGVWGLVTSWLFMNTV